MLGNIDTPNRALVAQSLAQQFASGVDPGAHRGTRVEAGESGGSGPPRLAGRRGAGCNSIVDVSTSRKELTLYDYAAGMAVFFLFFTVQFGVTSVLDERRDGTLARMFAAPIRPQRRARRQAADEPRARRRGREAAARSPGQLT